MQATNSIVRFLLRASHRVFINADLTAVTSDIAGLVIVILGLMRINNCPRAILKLA